MSNKMRRDLSQPHTLAFNAALYELEAAERDFHEAYEAFKATGARAGSPEDYTVWHASGYEHSARLVVREIPVWESTP